MALASVVLGTACRHRPPPTPPSTLQSIEKIASIALPSSLAVDAFVGEPKAIVTATRSEVRVVGDPYVVATVPSDWAHGLSALDKVRGRDDLEIRPLRLAVEGVPPIVADGDARSASGTKDEEASTRPRIRGEPGVPDVIVAADASTPYRLIAELVASSTAQTVGLAVRAGDGVGAIPLGRMPLPASGRRPRRQVGDEGYGLIEGTLVHVGSAGFSIEARRKHLASGCHEPGAGVTIPRVAAGDHDWRALEACLDRVRAASPAEGQAYAWIEPESDVELGTVVRALDAILGPRGKPRFEFVTPLVARDGAAQ